MCAHPFNPWLKSSLNSGLYLLPDFLVLGKLAGFELRENAFSIDAYFKAAAVGGYEHEPFDLVFEFGNELFGQTDRFRFVVSNLAVDDFDFHYLFSLFD